MSQRTCAPDSTKQGWRSRVKTALSTFKHRLLTNCCQQRPASVCLSLSTDLYPPDDFLLLSLTDQVDFVEQDLVCKCNLRTQKQQRATGQLVNDWHAVPLKLQATKRSAQCVPDAGSSDLVSKQGACSASWPHSDHHHPHPPQIRPFFTGHAHAHKYAAPSPTHTCWMDSLTIPSGFTSSRCSRMCLASTTATRSKGTQGAAGVN